MNEFGHAHSDNFLQMPVCRYDRAEQLYYDVLDEETRAAIDRADSQPDIPQEQVEQRILNSVVKK